MNLKCFIRINLFIWRSDTDSGKTTSFLDILWVSIYLLHRTLYVRIQTNLFTELHVAHSITLNY